MAIRWSIGCRKGNVLTTMLALCPPGKREEEPALYRCQYACTRRDYLAWQVPGKCKPRQGSGDVISTILKKSASGGDQFFVRKAQVIGLGELLFLFGKKFTAGELYAYFVNARKLTCKRPHS